MEKDYENIRETYLLTDNELRALVRDELEMQLAIDPDDIDVSVKNFVVRLAGRVGTEEELRIAERVVSDIVGIENFANELVVDPIRRAESPEAIDEHLVDEELHEGLLLGDRPGQDDPEAAHLREDVRAELFGTTDVREAIEGAIPWNPPDGPTPEGVSGSDVTPEVLNDEH